MSKVPVCICLSRRNTPANGWFSNSAETVSLHVDYNSAVYVWWVCVGGHVRGTSSSMNCCLKIHLKDSKKMMMEKPTREEYLAYLLAFKTSHFNGPLISSLLFFFKPTLSCIFLCCLIYIYFLMCHLPVPVAARSKA